MGTTISIYSAQPTELVRLLQTDLDADPNYLEVLKAMDALPMADLSLHLQTPQDLDSLCRAMSKEGLDAPNTFREYLVEQAWCDDPVHPSASLTLLSDQLKQVMAHVSDTALERIALRWVDALRQEVPVETRQSPADIAFDPGTMPVMDADTLQSIRRTVLQALVDLCMVSRDAVNNGRALLMYLAG